MNNHAFHGRSSDPSNHSNKMMFSLAFQYLDLENGASKDLLVFDEDFNETAENVKQKIV